VTIVRGLRRQSGAGIVVGTAMQLLRPTFASGSGVNSMAF
jgi:hypothetical protein